MIYNNIPQLIGLTGYSRCGKDTMADYLVENYNYKKIAFADLLKEVCKLLFSFSNDQLYGDSKEDIDEFWGISPREILQFFGTKIFREKINEIMPSIQNDFWIKALSKKLKILLDNGERIIITDLRFKNEEIFLKQNGAYIIKIINPFIKLKFYADKEIDNINHHKIIYNNNSKNNYYLIIDLIFKLKLFL